MLLTAALLRIWAARETVGWRAVRAEVVARQAPEPVVLEPSPAAARADSTSEAAIRVRYRYAAGRRSYVGSALVRGSRSELSARLDEFRPGAPVTAYVAPAQPWRSVLTRGVGLRHWAAIAGGLLLVVLSVAWVPRAPYLSGDHPSAGRGQ